VPVRVEPYGVLPDGRTIERHALINAAGTQVTFLSLGGIIDSLVVRDRHGERADVTPGYDSLEHYLADTHYFGALIGRVANRIAGSRFVLDGTAFCLVPNDGPHHLHGGAVGFHRAVWHVEPFASARGVGATLTHTSAAGDAGYPGALDVRVTYALGDNDELRIDFAATADAPTPVNLTQHSYFNLAGHAAGDVLDHALTVRASRYLPVDAAGIPTGAMRPVDGTPFDFRRPTRIGEGLRGHDGACSLTGYDHSLVLDVGAPGAPREVARLVEPRSGRVLEILTTEPGLQLYSGNRLGAGERGKGNFRYRAHSAVALETQHFPNSPNEPAFPSTILRPGSEFRSTTIYRFGVI
jgi:aldose 1-epimerase